MDYKYRILENGIGEFTLQRKGWFLWSSLNIYHTFNSEYKPEVFTTQERAVEWLNAHKKSEKECEERKFKTKSIVKCINLVPENEGE